MPISTGSLSRKIPSLRFVQMCAHTSSRQQLNEYQDYQKLQECRDAAKSGRILREKDGAWLCQQKALDLFLM